MFFTTGDRQLKPFPSFRSVLEQLAALVAHGVVAETANRARTWVSMGADSRFGADGGVLDAGERLVDLEHVSNVLCALCLQSIP